MHFQGLDLNLLVVLDAILDEKSVTRAAERLHVSQPAVSTALQKLRTHTRDQLLQRVGREHELTPRARQMAPAVKELLFQIKATINTAGFEPATSTRTFRVGMSTYCAEVLGPPLIRRLLHTAPGVVCSIDELSGNSLMRLRQGEIDFCITFRELTLLDPTETSEGLMDAPLFKDAWVIVAAADNEALSGSLTYEAFCTLPYIETRFAGNVMSYPERFLNRQIVRPRSLAHVPSFKLALALVAETSAVTIVPSLLLRAAGSSYRYKAVDLPIAISELDEMLVWHIRNDLDPGFIWFRELLAEMAQGLYTATGDA